MSKYGHRPYNWHEAIVNKLGGEEGANRFLRGELEVVVRKHIIDLDADPYCPGCWEVEEHRKGGQLVWLADSARLHFEPTWRSGRQITWREMRRRLINKPVLNANVLDYLLANKHLIPQEWKEEAVFFFGTIYHLRNSTSLVVRYLDWDGDFWNWHHYWINKLCGTKPYAVPILCGEG